MAHVRIRKFTTKEWYRGTQNLGAEFCMAVRAGNRVFLRGQTGHDFEGNFHGHGDPGVQADQAMRNVKVLLEEAGADLGHITKVTTYITDRAYRDAVYQAIGRHLKGVYPCGTGLIVKGLARPYMSMEVDIEAVIPPGEGRPPTEAG